MNIGEKLIKLRREKHVSQEKLAEKLGITRQTLSNWESNITSPDLNYAKMLSEIFDVSLDELIGNKEKFIESKVSNTQKLVLKGMKINKITLITIYVLTLTGLLIIGIIGFMKKDFTKENQTEITCLKKDEQKNISLTTREDNHFDVEVVREGGYVERIPAGIYIYQAIESVNVVKKNLFVHLFLNK